MQGRGFNSFASNRIKLSVNETEWSSLLARTRALILYIYSFRFENLISDPKRYRGFRETGPWYLVVSTWRPTEQMSIARVKRMEITRVAKFIK